MSFTSFSLFTYFTHFANLRTLPTYLLQLLYLAGLLKYSRAESGEFKPGKLLGGYWGKRSAAAQELTAQCDVLLFAQPFAAKLAAW